MLPTRLTSQTPLSELGPQCDLIETVPGTRHRREALPQRPQSRVFAPPEHGAGNPAMLARGGVFLRRFPSQRNPRWPEKLSRRPSRLNREAHHATKAALAGLRSGSIRSAGYRNGYDCTARI
jgi:hypothetical protein